MEYKNYFSPDNLVNSVSTDIPHGLLFSQIGYELQGHKKIMLRGDISSYPGILECSICEDGVDLWRGVFSYWGEKWGSHWWIADFSDFAVDGEFELKFFVNNYCVFETSSLNVCENVLWDATWLQVGLEQAEIRYVFAYQIDEYADKLGWFDSGAMWQTANSHAAYLFGLCDIYDLKASILSFEELDRLVDQLINGAEYLLLLQNMAVDLGYERGPLVHQAFDKPNNYESKPCVNEIVLAGDVAKASAALARVASVITDRYPEKAEEYQKCAAAALDWLLNESNYSELPFCAFPHNMADDFRPTDIIPTSDLAMAVWAALELDDPQVFDLTALWVERQILPEESEDGIYGHFRLLDMDEPTEKMWWHGVGEEGMGYNNGQTLGNYLMPLVNLLKRYPDDEDADLWMSTLKKYAYGYLVPGCKANPFCIVPYGYYADEGFINFAGLWHGANAIYGNTAALALEFEKLFNDEIFGEIAHANLQWIAGLNSGVTKDSLKSCTMTKSDIPEGVAIPCSMINGIGNRSVGSWMNITGSICNGFATGKQFVWDVEPAEENDGPFSFTDEDWITHAGAWLSALARL